MEMRNLGKSGLKVSELCLGTMTFGSKGVFNQIGKVDLKEASELIGIAFDSGINFFDTADTYSEGESEIVLGKALGSKRKDSIICTKVRLNAGGKGPNDQGLSRYHIINGCNDSLKRLNTDYIDIYMVHEFDIHAPLEETLKALDDLVRWGKVRYIGCSNYTAWQFMKALSISEKYNLEKFITYQGYYSLLSRDIEYEIIPLSLDQGVGIMVWSPLSGGYLTGKFHKESSFPKGTRVGDESQMFLPPVDLEKAFRIIDKLEEIAKNHDVSIAQAALNFLLKKPAVSTVILGTRKKEQLIDNIKTVNWDLSKEEMDELDNLSSIPPIYPLWHQISTGSDK